MGILGACPAAVAGPWSVLAPPAQQRIADVSVRDFARAVASHAGGEPTFTAVAAGQAARIPEELAGGAATLGVFPLATLEVDNPVVAMDRVPYLAANFIQARKLWGVLRPQVEEALASRNLVLLYAVPSPPPAPIARRPLTTLAEWRGARVAVGAPALEPFARALEARAVPVAAPDTALAGGEVDVIFDSAAYAADENAWEYASHYVHAPAWFPKQLVVIQRDAMAALAPASRDAVLAAASRAGEQAWRLSEEATRDGVQKLRDYGVKTVEPSVELLIGLEEVGRDLLFRWSDAAGETGAHLVEAYYAVR